MPKLRLEQAPAAALPLRFLLAMPCWGVAGGLLWLIDADAPLHGRWHPATLALVHVWTLGVLGNAMVGSLLQFLPAAVGAPVAGLRSGPWLHAVFNLGVIALVAGLHGNAPAWLACAGVLLPASFLWLAAMLLPGLWMAAGERLLRTGIGAALGFGVATALAGAALAWLLAWRRPWSPTAVDAHAAFGVLGWMVGLLAAVGRITLPMFQGTRMVSARAQAAWLAAVATALPVCAALAVRGAEERPLAWIVAAGAASFALAGLGLQWRVPRARRHALYRHWRLGLVAVLLAAAALVTDLRGGLLAGALALLAGLPLLVGGMALEIVPFVAWIALRRRVPRGVQLPGVQRLLPDEAKRRVLRLQAIAAAVLLAAVWWPRPWLARLAALVQVAAWTLHGHALAAALRTARDFRRRVASHGAGARVEVADAA